MNIKASDQDVKTSGDFGNQYAYFRESIDPRFPPPIMSELSLTVFSDSDHAHDKKTGRSITGIIAFLGSTPIVWSLKRQTSVQKSTYGAEFIALYSAVEAAVSLRYQLRSVGIKITQPTNIFEDNMSVCISSNNPGTTLNKKPVALVYHFVREHVANKVVTVKKVASGDNYADAFTKGLNSTAFRNLFYDLLSNT